jgi:hypothetical protein
MVTASTKGAMPHMRRISVADESVRRRPGSRIPGATAQKKQATAALVDVQHVAADRLEAA